MKRLLVFAILYLMNQSAFADSTPCERAIKQNTVSAFERHCAHLKNSQNASQRKFYYYMLALTYMGKLNFNAGSADPTLQLAIDNASRALAIPAPLLGAKSSNDAELYQLRGILYLQNKLPGEVISKDADKALKDFTAAISLNPKNGTNYLYRGYAHNQLFNPQAAWADFQKAKALNPTDPAIREAWEKQRRISPQGQAETLKELDQVTKGSREKFTCTATIRDVINEPEGETTLVVFLKDGCGIEPITVASKPPPECVVGAKVTATGRVISELVLLFEAERLVDVTQISCRK
jgi:tetratricopeptide (TPR) repeat protein